MRVGILVLLLFWRKSFQPFTTEYDVSCGFVISDLYFVEMWLLIFLIWWEFSLWMMLNFVKCFFCIYWDDHVIFILCLLMWCNSWFVDVGPPLCPWNKSHLIYCWSQFADILLNFCIYIYHILACNFFVVAFLSGFGIRIMVVS